MTCDELYGRLTDFTEGVLADDVCAAIEQHAAGCATCAAVRQDLADLSRLCREQAPAVMPPDVRQRIEVLLAGEPGALRPDRRP